jgi:hypothetical protein
MAILQIDFDEVTARALEPVFRLSSLTSLQLENCSVHPEGVGHLAACKQLQQLSLSSVNLAPGTAAAFTALAGLPSLDSLEMQYVSASEADDLHNSIAEILCSVGDSLTRLQYVGSSAGGDHTNSSHSILSILEAAEEKHLPSLTDLDVSYKTEPETATSVDHLDILADCCPRLRHLTLDRVIPTGLQSLATLMAMKDLQELAVEQPCEVVMPITCAWPADKARMRLECHVLPASVIPNLPLQHISELDCEVLDMGGSADSTPRTRTGEQEKLRSMLGVLHRTGVSLHTAAIAGGNSSHIYPPSGLSALSGPGCCLQPSASAELALINMTLDASDVLAVSSTWGDALQSLNLKACLLSATAWGAVNAVNLPNLTRLEVTYYSPTEHQLLDFCAHLTALCLNWPHSKNLDVVIVEHAQIASACQAALQGCGKTNVSIWDL